MQNNKVLTREPVIVQLHEIGSQDLGGKANGLAKLEAMGLAVPPAFVIHAAAKNHFPENLLENYQSLLNKALTDKVAVRSSALGEDGAEASFAGQYESVLNVEGSQALEQAINFCVDSVTGDRAAAYRSEQADMSQAVTMNVVVQAMVDAKAAGVVFTADPVSARRDLLVIDAVTGLGEALVSGEATPDHYAVHLSGDIVRRQLVGEVAILTDDEINLIAEQAREAAIKMDSPLDLEWALDQSGQLYWLQARPITTLPADLNEFDTVLPRVDDVLTISNVSEMMPGAVCPLTTSFTGYGIDYGLQHMQVQVGAREKITPEWQITASAYGHLLLNLTGNVVMGAALLGSDAERTAQTICGRPIPELKDLPPMPLWRRVWNMTRLLRYVMGASKASDTLTEAMKHFVLTPEPNSKDMMLQLSEKTPFYHYVMAVHLQTSALSGFLSSIVENMVNSGSTLSDGENQARTVSLLAGASHVESAVMLDELDVVVDAIAALPQASCDFQSATTEQALAWLQHTAPVDQQFANFLTHHGHRGYRELCMRDPAWADKPTTLIQSMQAAVQARLLGNKVHKHTTHIDPNSLSRGLRWILPKTHNAIRGREHTKSILADASHRFKRAFCQLGNSLEQEGKLPDADLVCFFALDELAPFVENPSEEMVKTVQARRSALDYQARLEMPEISVGLPQPVEAKDITVQDGVLHGRPACCGIVEGIARVALNLDEAAALQPGEILITPITDIGWTPYFSLIAGLATDLGSTVSHGAVIAREYGLPCVVNGRQATRYFQTGDHIRLDGDKGTISLLQRG
ncbi:MAG: PEP/pyruvate-binding domain-containing protein [Pseudomonadales bacterium]